jgi:hypothetical protein
LYGLHRDRLAARSTAYKTLRGIWKTTAVPQLLTLPDFSRNG